jgi:hypothetical protein
MAVVLLPVEAGPIKNGGFMGGIKGRINLARAYKLKPCPFQMIDGRFRRDGGGTATPAKTGVAA